MKDRAAGRDRGSATVELVLVLPVLAGLSLVGLDVFALVRAQLACTAAAQVGAAALDRGADPAQALRDAAEAAPPGAAVSVIQLGPDLVRVQVRLTTVPTDLLGWRLPAEQVGAAATGVSHVGS